MRRAPLAFALTLAATGCGRGDVLPLGLGEPDAGRTISDGGDLDAQPGPNDGGPGPFPGDGGPPPPDGGPPPPPPPDGGPALCRRSADCEGLVGPPPACPNGAPGQWECSAGICLPRCPECTTDCDCRFDLACAGGRCLPIDRRNLCCFNPDCPPGATCELPDGNRSMCPDEPPPPPVDGGPGPIDGGPFPIDGGPFPPDGGPPPPDGGPPPPDAGPTGTPVGAACTGGDCGPIGACIPGAQGFPGGYCTQDCGPVGSACPSGAECLSFGQGQDFCLDSCASNMDCRGGYACVQLGFSTGRVCWPVQPGSTNPNGDPVGSACASDNDCAQNLTCLQQGGFPGGYCTRTYCDPQTNPCPSGSACYAFPGLYSLCMAECPAGGTQSTCRRGYYCLGPTGSTGACFPN